MIVIMFSAIQFGVFFFFFVTVYFFLLMLGSRTNRNCLPNDGSFYFGGIVVSTSLFPNSGRSA